MRYTVDELDAMQVGTVLNCGNCIFTKEWPAGAPYKPAGICWICNGKPSGGPSGECHTGYVEQFEVHEKTDGLKPGIYVEPVSACCGAKMDYRRVGNFRPPIAICQQCNRTTTHRADPAPLADALREGQ